jgi:uncharacterized protein (TIGR04141 family)
MPKFTLYLAKDNYLAEPRYSMDDNAVNENFNSIFAPGVTTYINTQLTEYLLKHKCKLKQISQSSSNPNAYFRHSNRPVNPWWATFWKINEPITVQSADGLIILNVQNKIFLITHGQGRALINPLAIVHDFGLKTALNLLDPDKMRATDLFMPSEVAMTIHKRSGKDTRLSDYDIDIYNTLLKAVRGKCRAEYLDLFTSIDGTDSLKFALDGDASILSERCISLFQLYQSDEYKKLGFEWIDNFRPVKDKVAISELDEILSSLINKREHNLILLFPISFEGITDVYFLIKRVSKKYSDLRLREIGIDDYYRMLDRSKITTTPEMLKKHLLEALNAENDTEYASFSIYQCLYVEINKGGHSYFIESGVWYRVSSKFLSNINSTINQLIQNQLHYAFPYKISELAAAATKTKRNKEYIFNKRLAEYLSTNGSSLLLDSNLVHIGSNKIEIADIIHKVSGRILLIHNKYNHGASSLSHLFNQGYVSIIALLDPDFRNKANDKIADPELSFPDSFSADRSKYSIVYGIIMPRDSKGGFHIPLFGKISLDHFSRSIIKMGFNVFISIIEVCS